MDKQPEVTDEQVDQLHMQLSLQTVLNRLKDNPGGLTLGALLGDMSESEVNKAAEQLKPKP